MGEDIKFWSHLKMKTGDFMSVNASAKPEAGASLLQGISQSSSNKYDPVRMGPEDCVLRIEEIAKAIRSQIPVKEDARFNCPVTLEPMTDPIVLNCGHIFERSVTEQVYRRCPTCKAGITRKIPCYLVKSLIDDRQQEDRIPTMSHFEEENSRLAKAYLALAATCVAEEKYEKAFDAYSNAFLYTKKSEDYLALPLLYEKQGQIDKRFLACLHLAVYQLKESKIKEAVKTLRSCKIESLESFKIDALLVALTLEENPSQEKIQELLSLAGGQRDSEEAIRIYKQILAVNPLQFEAYTALCPLLNDLEEKNYLFSKAAEYAKKEGNIELEAYYRKESVCVYPNTVSRKDWVNPAVFLAGLPPMPQALLAFLEGPCPIYQGKQAKETHFPVPLTKNITTIVKGNPVVLPRTLKNLDQFDRTFGGTGLRCNPDMFLDVDKPSEIEFEWVVMTKEVLPGSIDQNYETQKRLVEEKGYEVPGLLEAATCILFANRSLGIRLYDDNPFRYTRCLEDRVFVGGFSLRGLNIHRHFHLSQIIGVAGLRKF